MQLRLDEYAHLDSPIHRWEPRAKFVALFALIIAFSMVRDLHLVPFMLVITAGLYALARLPLSFLIARLKYPGVFLLALVIILPLFTGSTVIAQIGFLSVRAEGLTYMALVVSRFAAILTVSLILFGTAPFMTHVRTLRRLGIPPLLADLLLLTVRYLFQIADAFQRMQIAMRLRGFSLTHLNGRSASQLAGLLASLFIRSYEQAERVYHAMRLRGYGESPSSALKAPHPPTPSPSQAIERGSSAPVFLPSLAGDDADTPALSITRLAFSYPGRPPVLNGIDLSVQYGERVGVIGANGAGKTSLFLTICGVLTPSSGEIRAGGELLPLGKVQPSIGLVFQNSDDQLFSPTVREDVAFGAVNLSLSAAEVEARVSEALTLTGAAHLADRAPHHLSGGEKRMVAIAAVLAMRPRLVLYDEPDANLDSRARRRLIHFLQAAPHTLLLASHDLELILEVCDRVIVLDEGRVVADGAARTIMADQVLMQAHGLEKPHSLIPHTHLSDTGSNSHE